MAYRVFLVEDHPIARAGYRILISREPDLEVCGEAASAEDAFDLIPDLHPDLVVVDLSLPGVNGIELIKRLDALDACGACLVISAHDEALYADRALGAGARGYLLKGVSQDEITTAIRAVAAGQVIFGSGMATRIMTYFSQAPATTSSAFPQLTERELEILELLASGCGTVDISARTHLAQKTVSNQLTGIFAKLQVANRTEAVIRARDAGLGTLREA